MIHVSAEEVIALHDYLLKRYAGVAGMSDPGRAEAIVARVINREYYEGIQDILSLQQPIGWQSHAGIFLPMRIREPRLT